MSESNPTPTWKRPPTTLSAALKRLATLEQHIFWLNDEIRGLASSWLQERNQVIHLERVLEHRWNVNDARAQMQPDRTSEDRP